MLTRKAAELKRLLELDSSYRGSNSPSEDSQAESEDSSQSDNTLISLRTILSNPRMEEANAALATPLRKKLVRIQGKTARCKESLSRQRDQDTPSTSNYELLKDSLAQLENYRKEHDRLSEELFEVEDNPTAIAEDEHKSDEFEHNLSTALRDCQHLISQRTVYRDTLALESAVRGLTTAYEASPDNDHSSSLDLVRLRSKDLENNLLSSLMSEEEELRGRANTILERSATIQGESRSQM